MFLGIAILAIGVFLLLREFGILSGSFWSIFWALIFIAIGLKLILKRKGYECCGWNWFGSLYHPKMHHHKDKRDENSPHHFAQKSEEDKKEENNF